MCRAGNKPFRRRERGEHEPERGTRASREWPHANGKWRKGLALVDKADGKALRQDRRVEFLLTRSLRLGLEKDKLLRDQEDMEGELSASRREIGADTDY